MGTTLRVVQLAIEEIVVEGRHRRCVTGVEELAQSIVEVGLLHPIVVTASKRLVAGGRRVAAYRYLRRTHVPAYIVDNLEEVCLQLQAEAAENTCRQPLLPSEAVSQAEALLPYAQQAARKRQAHQEPGAYENFSQVGVALNQIAKQVGMSRPTLTEARKVVAAAREELEIYGDLVETMDREGKVHGAYLELRRRQGETTPQTSTGFSLRMNKKGEFKVSGSLGNAELLEHLKVFMASLLVASG